MDRVSLGEFSVSRIGFGCYSMALGDSPNTPADWVNLIREAHGRGVNFFDTADQYGPAEEILGRAVGPFRDEVVVATKAGVTPDRGPDASPEHIRRACDASLSRLGTDRIDLYQVHYDDPGTPVADTVAALEDLRERGKIRMYGVGHLPAARVQEYIARGRPASLLFELSPAARLSRRDLVPLCRPDGPRGIAFSPTGRGVLTTGAGPGGPAGGGLRAADPLFQREKLASGLRIRDHLAEVGRSHGKTPAQVAIAWVLAQPGIAVALTGTSRPDHLRENLGAVGWSLPAGQLAALDRLLEREDEWLREESIRTARAIAGRPLPREGPAPYADLIYLAEVAVEYGLAREAQLMPVIVRLLATRKRARGAWDPSLEDIRREMAAIIGES